MAAVPTVLAGKPETAALVRDPAAPGSHPQSQIVHDSGLFAGMPMRCKSIIWRHLIIIVCLCSGLAASHHSEEVSEVTNGPSGVARPINTNTASLGISTDFMSQT